MTSMDVFSETESEVRSYCRSFPAVFERAEGHTLWSEEGKEYIDFFAGAGALNYGHNNPRLKERLIEYIAGDGITHGLDMATRAKAEFLQCFRDVILTPRRMEYKVMFPGPTGTNAVESALKLARKVTGRQSVICFTNAFHGMTLGALSVTGNQFKRHGAGIPLHDCVRMPYEGYVGHDGDSIQYLEKFLEDNGSGVGVPAAIILETVQCEGGVNVASFPWLRQVEEVCRRWGILLIIDDIQAGCGRTGPFFSFEGSGIAPDIVCLSKSIGGYGLPMALTLLKPELDVWEPGEHNGTFRGNNPAFVTATEALRTYWSDDAFRRSVEDKAERVRTALLQMVQDHPEIRGEVRGRGLVQGLACSVDGFAESVSAACFERGLILETAGADSEVIKILPPLVISDEGLDQGLGILASAIAQCKDGSMVAES